MLPTTKCTLREASKPPNSQCTTRPWPWWMTRSRKQWEVPPIESRARKDTRITTSALQIQRRPSWPPGRINWSNSRVGTMPTSTPAQTWWQPCNSSSRLAASSQTSSRKTSATRFRPRETTITHKWSTELLDQTASSAWSTRTKATIIYPWSEQSHTTWRSKTNSLKDLAIWCMASSTKWIIITWGPAIIIRYRSPRELRVDRPLPPQLPPRTTQCECLLANMVGKNHPRASKKPNSKWIWRKEQARWTLQCLSNRTASPLHR